MKWIAAIVANLVERVAAGFAAARATFESGNGRCASSGVALASSVCAGAEHGVAVQEAGQGGHRNTLRGNAPAICWRFLISGLPGRRHAVGGLFMEPGDDDVEVRFE